MSDSTIIEVARNLVDSASPTEIIDLAGLSRILHHPNRELSIALLIRAQQVCAECSGPEFAEMLAAVALPKIDCSEAFAEFRQRALQELPTMPLQSVVHIARAWRRADIYDEKIFTSIAARISAESSELDSNGLGTLAWVFSDRYLEHPRVFSDLSREACKKITTFTSHDLADLALGCAKAGWHDQQLFELICIRAPEIPRNFTSRAFTDLVCACATADVDATRLLRTFSPVLVTELGSFSPRDLAQLTRALGTLGYREPTLLAALEHAIAAKLLKFNAFSLTAIIAGLRDLGSEDDRLLKRLLDKSLGVIAELNGHGIATLCFSGFKLRIPSQRLFETIAVELIARAEPGMTTANNSLVVDPPSPQGIANISWAFVKFRNKYALHDQKFKEQVKRVLACLSAPALDQMNAFNHKDIGQFAWALSHIVVENKELTSGVAQRIKGVIKDFSTQDLVNTLRWAQVYDPQDEELHQQFLQSIHKACPDLNGKDIGDILTYLLKTGADVPDTLRLLSDRTQELASIGQGLSPEVISRVGAGFSDLGFIDPLLFATLSASAQRAITSFKPLDLATTAEAFAKAGVLDNSLFSAIALKVAEGLPMQFAPRLLRAFAAAELNPHNVTQALLACIEGELPRYSGLNFVTILWSVAKLGQKDRWLMSDILRMLPERIEDLRGPALSDAFDALMELDITAPELFNRLGGQASRRAVVLTPQQRGTVALGIAFGAPTMLKEFLQADELDTFQNDRDWLRAYRACVLAGELDLDTRPPRYQAIVHQAPERALSRAETHLQSWLTEKFGNGFGVINSHTVIAGFPVGITIVKGNRRVILECGNSTGCLLPIDDYPGNFGVHAVKRKILTRLGYETISVSERFDEKELKKRLNRALKGN